MGRAELLAGMAPQLTADVTLFATEDRGEDANLLPSLVGDALAAHRGRNPLSVMTGCYCSAISPSRQGNNAVLGLYSFSVRRRPASCEKLARSTSGKGGSSARRESSFRRPASPLSLTNPALEPSCDI